jgi:hypothetical protein
MLIKDRLFLTGIDNSKVTDFLQPSSIKVIVVFPQEVKTIGLFGLPSVE